MRDLISEGLSPLESQPQTTGEVYRYCGNGEKPEVSISNVLRLYYITDHLGSVREMVDSSGVVRASYDYSPEGTRARVAGDLEGDFGFTGHYTHEATGLVAAPFRFYVPSAQHWLSRDPIEEEGGINLYGYVGNRVASETDLLGFSPQDVKKLEQQFDNKLGDMTRKRERLSHGEDSNIEQFFSDLIGDKKSPDMSCGGQATAMENYLRNIMPKLKLDDKWKVCPKTNKSKTHSWTELESSNPKDPILKFDTWQGTRKRINK